MGSGLVLSRGEVRMASSNWALAKMGDSYISMREGILRSSYRKWLYDGNQITRRLDNRYHLLKLELEKLVTASRDPRYM